jgi:hypothetical protein
LCLVSVVCCWVEVSATGRSLVQRCPTEFVVTECDLDTSTKERSRRTRTFQPREQKNYYSVTATEMCKSMNVRGFVTRGVGQICS